MLHIPFCYFLVSKKVGFLYPKTITSRKFIAIHDIFFELVLRHRFNSLNMDQIILLCF